MRSTTALSCSFALIAWLGCSSNSPQGPAAPPTASVPSTPPTASAPSAPSASPTNTPPQPSKAGPEGAMCGGIAGFGCAAGLYCAFAPEAQCGAADQSGVCRTTPQMCTAEYLPVCGCDDKTYGNECEAARAGVSVSRRGECKPAAPLALAEGQTCGTRGISAECAAGLYCKYKVACGATDAGGTCTKRPEMCTKVYRPVCGCDGKTYPSDCTAASAGVAVQHDGACKK